MNMEQLKTLLRKMKLKVPISFTEYALLINFEIKKIGEGEEPLVQIPSLIIRRERGTLRVPAFDIYNSLMDALKKKSLTLDITDLLDDEGKLIHSARGLEEILTKELKELGDEAAVVEGNEVRRVSHSGLEFAAYVTGFYKTGREIYFIPVGEESCPYYQRVPETLKKLGVNVITFTRGRAPYRLKPLRMILTERVRENSRKKYLRERIMK